MKLSVIIPCFNEEKTIYEVIKKILEQVEINKEIIIVNDGSTDKTLEKIKKISEEGIKINVIKI